MTVVTEAFETAASMRAGVLGLPQHPTVVVEHPIASRTLPEVRKIAEAAVGRVAAGLAREGA